MSELKPYIGPHPTDHTLTEYYLKSEADKVIAHQKYKRCLAMAWWCKSRSDICFEDVLSVKDVGLEPSDELIFKVAFSRKWQKRWLKLAEKFKEAK